MFVNLVNSKVSERTTTKVYVSKGILLPMALFGEVVISQAHRHNYFSLGGVGKVVAERTIRKVNLKAIWNGSPKES